MFSWLFKPTKRCFPPGHTFFEEGDICCSILLKQLFVPESIEQFISLTRPEFKCEVSDCNDYFQSIADYEGHYNSFHRHSCSSCHRAFPSNYLLEIHIAENHDPLFQTLVASSKFMFRCLVEACPDKFTLEKERKDHLVKLHKYPSDFRFNRPSRKKKRAGKSAYLNMHVSEVSMEVDQVKGHHDERMGSDESVKAPKTSHVQAQLPRTICFGRGSVRSFHKHNVNKKGKSSLKHRCKSNDNQNKSMKE